MNAYSTYVAENFHDEYENKMICLEEDDHDDDDMYDMIILYDARWIGI